MYKVFKFERHKPGLHNYPKSSKKDDDSRDASYDLIQVPEKWSDLDISWAAQQENVFIYIYINIYIYTYIYIYIYVQIVQEKSHSFGSTDGGGHKNKALGNTTEFENLIADGGRVYPKGKTLVGRDKEVAVEANDDNRTKMARTEVDEQESPNSPNRKRRKNEHGGDVKVKVKPNLYINIEYIYIYIYIYIYLDIHIYIYTNCTGSSCGGKERDDKEGS
jgi:hypothetical protein